MTSKHRPQGQRAQTQDAWITFCNQLRHDPDLRRRLVEDYERAFGEYGLEPTKTALSTFLGAPEGTSVESWAGWVALRSVLTTVSVDFVLLPEGAATAEAASAEPADSTISAPITEDASPLEQMLTGLQGVLAVDLAIRADVAGSRDPIADLFGPQLRRSLSLQLVQRFLGAPDPHAMPQQYQAWMESSSVLTVLTPTIPNLPDAPISPYGACELSSSDSDAS